MEEGYYKQIGEPKPYYKDGIEYIEKIGTENIPWIVIELEEVSIPFRSFN